MSGGHESQARVISMAEQRAAREAAGADAGASSDAASAAGDDGTRPHCSAQTTAGRPCRNYAVDDGLCRVHAVQERGSGGDATDTDHDSGTDDARARLEAAAARRGWQSPVDALEAIRDAIGDEWLEGLRELASFLRRRLTGDYDIDPFGFDEDLTTNVLMPLVRPLHRYYWRVSSHGTEHLPRGGGGLLVANHAGTLPADALITRLDVYEHTGRHARELGADLVFRTPFIGELARKAGVTLASGDDADRLLAGGELVAVWPEGYKGLGKKWKDRYKLQRFGRGGFVATALRAQVPIVPVAIVGSEEIYPMIYDLRLLARLLGLPYFPVVAQSLALPVLGPLALLPLPSKWVIEYGEPIDTSAYGPDAADDPMVVFDLADQVRDTIQELIYRSLMGRRSVFF